MITLMLACAWSFFFGFMVAAVLAAAKDDDRDGWT